MIKKVFLFVFVLVLSYFLAEYSGAWYGTISEQYGSLFFDKSDSLNLLGFVLSYIFLIPFVFGLFGIKQNKKLIAFSVLPALLLVIWADTSTFYVPILIVASALILSCVIRSVFLKIKNI